MSYPILTQLQMTLVIYRVIFAEMLKCIYWKMRQSLWPHILKNMRIFLPAVVSVLFFDIQLRTYEYKKVHSQLNFFKYFIMIIFFLIFYLTFYSIVTNIVRVCQCRNRGYQKSAKFSDTCNQSKNMLKKKSKLGFSSFSFFSIFKSNELYFVK